MNIIITGASKGIGFEIVRLLAADKEHKILAISRSLRGLEQLKSICKKENLPGKVMISPFDLTRNDVDSILIPEIKSVLGHVDILVNNAGLMITKPFINLNGEDFDKIFSANVKSIFLLIRSLLGSFSKNAHIVNIGSMGGYQGSQKFPGLSLYSASKGALAILTECLAEELKDYSVKVNCLALGAAQTEMLSQAFPGYQAPLTAAQLASFIAEFAIRGHHYFNGKILPVSLSTP